MDYSQRISERLWNMPDKGELPNELLVKIMKDPKQRSDFLNFCHRYDSNPFVCGMGKDNLLAQGEL